MKLKVFIVLFVSLSVTFMAYHFYKTSAPQSSFVKLTLANIEALAVIDDEYDAKLEKECREKDGYWMEALHAVDGGVEMITCEVSGSITIFGMTFSGSYKKGHEYPIAWTRYECEASEKGKNCCIKDEQGLFVNGEKVS